MTKSILIIGSKGMLGQELVKTFDEDGFSVTAWDRDDIDVTDTKDLKEKVTALWPDIIVNAVAYNAVDLCEESDEEKTKAIALNVTYPGALASIAKNLNATIVHYSSDYVFDGERPEYKDGERAPGCCSGKCRNCMYEGPEETLPGYFAYAEDDKPRPLSVYGQSKYDGEMAVEKYAGSSFYIIRLSKLFGAPAESTAGKKSFFDVMLQKGRETHESGETVKAVDGEMSKFTYAPDLALETRKILEDNCASGIYHVVNDGPSTWYDGVKALYRIAGVNVDVTPVPPDAFPRPALRPSSSVLAVTKRTPLRHYEEALAEYLSEAQS